MSERPERRRYRVLMVAACPFPANYGTPGCIKEMSETMAELGHEVHILTYPYGDNLPVRGARLHRVPNFGWSNKVSVGPTAQKPILDLFMALEACRLIWKYRCDLIHAHCYEGQLVGICARLVTWRPLLYNAVNSMSDELVSYNFIKPDFLARWLAAFLDWLIPKFSSHILALTPELRDMLVAQGVPDSHITVVPAGVLPELFASVHPNRLREALHLQNKRVVLYAGTLASLQRVDILVEAFAKLGPEYSDVMLLIVSPFPDHKLRPKLTEQAVALGIAERICWVDTHSLEELPDYLALADVAVMPRPQCPGHPIKLLNYMGATLPIVASAGGAKGLRHLENAFVFRDRDSAHLAEGITSLLQDRALAQRLGRAGRQTLLDEYDWRVLCRRIEAIYDRIIRNPS